MDFMYFESGGSEICDSKDCDQPERLYSLISVCSTDLPCVAWLMIEQSK